MQHPGEETPFCKILAGKFPKFSAGTLNFSARKILGIFHLGRDFKKSSGFVVSYYFLKVAFKTGAATSALSKGI